MDIRQQCLCCGSVYDQNNQLISPPTQPTHTCTHNHQGPWTSIQFNNNNNNNNNNIHQNGYNYYQQNQNQNQNQYQQQQPQQQHAQQQQQQLQLDDTKVSSMSMDIDLLSYEPLLIEAFKSEIHEYNTEVELTFGAVINFIDKFAAFVDNIDNYKMNDIISIVISKKQEVFLSEVAGENNNISNHAMIDQRPVYVRCILQLIYFSFLNYIYTDNEYKQFYKTYYKTDAEINEENEALLQLKNPAAPSSSATDNNIVNVKIKTKNKSTRQEDVDPFFQCFYECCAIYKVYYHKKKKLNEKESLSLRKYLELITANTMTVLKLMNGVIIWINNIKLNSIRLVLQSSNIDISLYEFSQLLQCITLQTQHAVWQRIQKNTENQISDKQNLSLCIHILLCIAIKDKTGNAQYPNTQNPDEIYAEFLDKIVSCLSIHFLNKKNENKILMEFGDLVEKLPLWILNCDKILQKKVDK